MPKEKYEKPGRQHTYMSAADVAAGKQSTWYSIEITGKESDDVHDCCMI